jgi:hypothetical protein
MRARATIGWSDVHTGRHAVTTLGNNTFDPNRLNATLGDAPHRGGGAFFEPTAFLDRCARGRSAVCAYASVAWVQLQRPRQLAEAALTLADIGETWPIEIWRAAATLPEASTLV